MVCEIKFLLANLVAFISQKEKMFGLSITICLPAACESWYSYFDAKYRYVFVV